ncbi:MAG: hypothetical protein ACJAYU_001144 [Bradymonadia bacterium]
MRVTLLLGNLTVAVCVSVGTPSAVAITAVALLTTGVLARLCVRTRSVALRHCGRKLSKRDCTAFVRINLREVRGVALLRRLF